MWLCVFLLYSGLQESSGCTVERGDRGTITRSAGGSGELPCFCEEQKTVSPQTVKWGFTKDFKGYTNIDQSVFPEDSRQNPRYRGRVRRRNRNQPGDLSLIISHLTEEDEGTYVCGIGGRYSSFATLYVRGCTVLDRGPVIFSRSPGESVLLPCPCPKEQQNIDPGRVTWSFSKTGTEDQTAVSNDAASYRGRVWMFDQSQSRNFSLLISDLTEDDRGSYTCRAGDHTVSVGLEVTGCALSENKQTVPVSRSSGESILLSCSCTDLQDKPKSFQWRTPNHEDLLQSYSGRVQTFDQSSPGNLSVLISGLTEEDGGTYSCWINQNQYRNFSLTVKGCTLSETQEKVINKYPGDSVLLPCSCADQHTKPVSVKWERVDSGGTEVSNETELYRGRVQMFNKNLPANLSLLISNLTEEDQGTYRCSINNKQSLNIRLSIKDCTLSQTQEELISRYPGESVLLPCSCTDQHTRPVSVKWERVDSGGTEVSNETELYRGRVQMFNRNLPANLSLLISSLTEEDQGTYRCSINNKRSISISLSIKDCTLSETEEKVIHKYPGESVLLPCSCADQHTKPVSVKWERVDSGGTEVSNETELYRGRVQMFNKNLPANLSLLISNLTEEDQGTYRCSINNKQSINISLSITGCTLSETQEKTIHKYPGESVLLPCSCTDQHTKPVSVKWERVDSGETEVSNKMKNYTGRVQMFNKILPANLSLLISNLTEQDQGTYRCSINNKQSLNITLSITGCTLSETQEKLIIGSPGESVLLPCSCTDQHTKPINVKWERVDSGGTEVSNETPQYRGEMFNKNFPANLSLLISNLTQQDQGTYRCSINNKQSINISLSITEAPAQTNKPETWMLIAIVCALLLILLLLLGGAACTCCKYGKGRKKSKGKETGQRRTEDDITYSTIIYRGRSKQPENQDNVTYTSLAHGTKDKPAKTEDDVTYSSLVHGKKATQRQAEEDVTYSDVAFRKNKSAEQKDDVTYSSIVHGKKGKKPKKQAEEDVTYSEVAFCKAAKSSEQEDQVTISSVALKSEKDAEEPTVYASVRPAQKK